MSAKHLCFSEQPTLLEVLYLVISICNQIAHIPTKKKKREMGFLVHHILKLSDKFHLLISYYCFSSLILLASN